MTVLIANAVTELTPRRFRTEGFDRILRDGIPCREVANTPTHVTLRRLDGPIELDETFTHAALFALMDLKRLFIEEGYFAPENAAQRVTGRGVSAIGRAWVLLTRYEQKRTLYKEYFCQSFFERAAKDRRVSTGTKSLDVLIPQIHAAFVQQLKADLANDNPAPEETPAPPKRGRQSRAEKERAKRAADPTATAPGEPDPYERPAARTLRTWLKQYKTGGRDALAELGERRGNRSDRFVPEIREALNAAAREYMASSRPSGKDVHVSLVERVKAINAEQGLEGDEQLKAPSLAALYRAIKRLDSFATLAARKGKAHAKARFYPVHEGVNATYPFERVEMDEWEVPLITLIAGSKLWEDLSDEERASLHKQKCTLTVAIDCATRVILVMHLSLGKPSGETAIAGLRMMLSDKTALAREAGNASPWPGGRPFQLFTDRGPGFRNELFRAIAADLAIMHDFTPGGHPQARGTIERVFPTLERYTLAHASGRTFNNPEDRGEYKPAEHACLTEHELNRALIRALDIYHNKPHEGLDGETPLHCFNRLSRERCGRMVPGPDRLRHIFGSEQKLAIGNHGISFHGLDYQCEELQVLRRYVSGKVRVRIDLDDLGAVSVFTHEKSWISVPCVDPLARGLSRLDWVAAVKRLRQRHADEAALVRPIVEQAIADVRGIHEAARIRAGLPPLQPTPEEIERDQRDLFRNFRIRLSAATPASDEPLLGEEPTGAVVAQALAPSPYSDLSAWSVEP
ncbi:transposase [Microvirga sp. BT688]|uniref:Mu transposase C-terminal domain-containing protein n=1 Tax=Microvirga sp. TaxID=1873136 RepID=UPI00168547EF|nr:Mu transposase C-terminal domain-containing protein [Microvirga sp.]MBD2746622.1 transposase [Microvirga sp.]